MWLCAVEGHIHYGNGTTTNAVLRPESAPTLWKQRLAVIPKVEEKEEGLCWETRLLASCHGESVFYKSEAVKRAPMAEPAA